VLWASDYDRFYYILGVEPGGSLSEIEAQWKLCCAAVHPDKFASDAKAQATRRVQEINNARDELRRYWRRHGSPPPTSTGNGPRITTVRLRDDPADADMPPPDEARVVRPADAGHLAPAPDRAAPKQWRRVPAFAAVVAVGGAIALVAVGLLQEDEGTARSAGSGSMAAVQSAQPLEAPLPASSLLSVARSTAPSSASVASQSNAPNPSEAAPPPIAPRAADPAGAAQLAPATARAASPGSAVPANPWLSMVGAPPLGAPQSAGPERPATPKSSRVAALPPPGSVAPPAAPPQSHWQRATFYTRQEELRHVAIDACRNDLRTFCAGVQAGGGRIAQCVREHFQQLSSGCSGVLLALRSLRLGGAASAER
jgi:hypothetical protein